MFSRFLPTVCLVLAISSQVHAHGSLQPFLGVTGALAKSDISHQNAAFNSTDPATGSLVVGRSLASIIKAALAAAKKKGKVAGAGTAGGGTAVAGAVAGLEHGAEAALGLRTVADNVGRAAKKPLLATCAVDSQCQTGCCGFSTGRCTSPFVALINGSGGCGRGSASKAAKKKTREAAVDTAGAGAGAEIDTTASVGRRVISAKFGRAQLYRS
ncbi:hypothetical protein C8R47DRAFT_1198196 [Mycena vitilis]|nr:hypothetical protein C8R47DRAFT_1198196 [Mycena vitilis]